MKEEDIEKNKERKNQDARNENRKFRNKKEVSRNMKRNVQEQFRVILGNKANESLEMILPRFSGEGNKCMTSKQEEIHYVIREEKQTQELPV